MLGLAERLREEAHEVYDLGERKEYEPNLATIKAALSSAVFQQEWSAGRAWSVDDARSFILTDFAPPPGTPVP